MQEVTSLPKDKNISGQLSSFAAKLAAHPLLLSLLFNLAAFIFRILVFDIKYEVSDDYITDAVLSGAFGNGYDPQLLFSNIILGYVLVFLYKLIPTISFYFVLLIALSFVSCTIVLYLLFKRKVNTITVCIAVVYLAFITDDLYVLVQFTKVSAVAGIAGGLLILHGLWEAKKHRVLYVVLGALLTITGSMVRFGPVLVFCAFLVLAFLYHTISRFSEISKSKDKSVLKSEIIGLTGRFMVCVVVVGSLYGFMYLGSYLQSLDETHKEFHAYQDLRCNITDKTRPEFEDIEEAYKEYGFDFIDYAMLNSWNFDDRDVYSDEILVKVAELQQNAVKAQPLTIGDVAYILIARGVLNYPVAFALYIPALLALALDKKRIYALLLILSSYALLVGFVYYGRTVYRVEWGIYYCAASCLVATFNYDEESKLAKLKRTLFGKERNTLSIYTVILVAVLLIARAPRILTRYTLLNCSDEEYSRAFQQTLSHSGEYVNEKYGFPTLTRKLSPNLIERMENDDEHYYIVDFATGIQDFYFNYDPWIRPEEGLFENYAYFGGCTMRYPGELKVLEDNGCDPYNPFKSLVNDNVLLVDVWGYEYKWAYIMKYYYPDAKIELVEIVDGYSIWNIYIPEESGET